MSLPDGFEVEYTPPAKSKNNGSSLPAGFEVEYTPTPSKPSAKPKSMMDKVGDVAKGIWDDLTMKTDVDDKADAMIAKQDQQLSVMPQGWQKTTSKILQGVNKALNAVTHPIDTLTSPIKTIEGKMPAERVAQKQAHDAERADIDAVHNVSALHNPTDMNLWEMGKEITGNGTGQPKQVSQQDKQNYYNSVKKAMGDGYEVQLEEGTLRPYFKKTGEGDEKYRPVLNDLFDADGVEIRERIKANSPTWVPEVALDMAAFAAGATIGKKYQVAGKAGQTVLGTLASFLSKPNVLGTVSALSVSGWAGGQAAEAQIAYSGEELSQERHDAIVNDEAINNALGGLVGIGVVATAKPVWNGMKSAGGLIKEYAPLHSVKGGAERYTDKNLVRTMEEDVQNRATLDMIGKMFGKVGDDERDLTYYLGFEEGRKVLRDLYNGNPEELKATLLDSIQLTKNLKDSMGLDDKTSKDLFYFMQDGMNGVKAYYDRLYEQAKVTVKDTIGKEVIPQQSQTLSMIQEMIDQAKRPLNVKGEQVPNGVSNEFNKDFTSLLENLKTLFRDQDEMSIEFNAKGMPNIVAVPKYAEDYTVEGILRVQKQFNDFFYKHKDAYSRDQMEMLSSLKGAIYDDIENGIRHSSIDEESKDALMSVWQKTNAEYSQYKDLLNNHQLLFKLLNKNEKFDVAAFTQKILSRANEINGEDADTLSAFAQMLSKTQPHRVNQFYDSIIGGMIDASMRKNEVQMGTSVDYVAFDDLTKMWNSMDEGIKTSIFSHTEEGKQIKATMDSFDQLAKREAALQDAIINEAKLPAVVAQERDMVRRFLYGAAYMAKAIAYDWWGARVFRSKAFQVYVQKLAHTQRYGDIERATNKLAYELKSNPPQGMSPKSIANLRSSIQAYQKAMRDQAAAAKEREGQWDALHNDVRSIVDSIRAEMKQYEPAEIARREHEALKGELMERGGYSDNEAEAMASGKELMGFKEYDAIRSRLIEQGYNEEEADGMLKSYLRNTDAEEKAKASAPEAPKEEHSSFTDWNSKFQEWSKERPAGESADERQEAWNKYVQEVNAQRQSQPAALNAPDNVGEWDEWNGDMYLSSSRDELDALIEEKSPKLNNLAENSMFAGKFADVVGGKSAQSIFSTFMGNKRQLSLKVASAVRQLFPKERREAIDTVNDYFGGSGSWGMFMAHPEMFPNVKSVNIYEYNPWRKFKIEMVHKQPQKVIDALKSDEIRAFYHVFQDYLKATTSSTGSAGQTLPNIEKLLVSPEGEIPDAVKAMVMNMDQAHHAALMYMVDTAVRKFNSYESFISNAVQNISKTATYVRRLKNNGVEFNYHNMSSYDDIAEYNVGDNVLSVIDPPYYKTKGYSAGQNGDVRSSTVDIGIYAKTAKLIEDITSGRGSVIYTDEKWYTKIEKEKVDTGELTSEGRPKMKEVGEKEVDRELSDEFDTQKSGGKNAYELFKGIVAPFDHFFTERVSSRNETIGIKVGGDYDVTQYRNNTGTKGNGDVLRPSDDGSGTEPRGAQSDHADGTEPVERGVVAEDGDGAGHGNAPRVEEFKGISVPDTIEEDTLATDIHVGHKAQEPAAPAQTAPSKNYEEYAQALRTNPVDPYEIKAVEALMPKDRGHTFSQSVIRPMQEGGERINPVVAQKYDEAVEGIGKDAIQAKAQELRDAAEMMKRERENPSTPEALSDMEHFKNYMKYTQGWNDLLKEFGENSGGVGRMVNKMMHDLKNGKPLSPEHKALWIDLSERMNMMREQWEPMYKADAKNPHPQASTRPADSVGKVEGDTYIDENGEAIEIPFSRGETSGETHTAESIKESLSGALGAKTLRKLSNVMEVNTKADIPDEVVAKAGGDINSIHGYVHNGKAYVVADNIPQGWNQEQVRGLVMHEVGVHLRSAGADTDKFDSILQHMASLKGKDERIKAAYDAVPKDTDASLIDEEALAYLVQNNPNTSIVRRVIAWVKGALMKMGVNPTTLKLNADDLSAMAWGAVKRGRDGYDDESIKFMSIESFGLNVPKYKGKPEEAIEHLLNAKKGQVIAAMHREDIGDIDFVYGRTWVDKKGKIKGYGLSKIEAKHGIEKVREIPAILRDGEITKRSDTHAEIRHDGSEAVIYLDWYKDKKVWVMTAYDLPHRQTLPDAGASAGKSGDLFPEGEVSLPLNDSNVKLSRSQSGGGFYHKADAVIEAKLANRATPSTIMGLLKNNGVKEDEIVWSRIEGIANELAGNDGKVNKTELLEAIKKERPAFGTKRYGKPDITDYDVRDEVYSNIKDEIAEFRGITPEFQKALDEWYHNPTDKELKDALQEVMFTDLDYALYVDDAIESAARRMNKGTHYNDYTIRYMGDNYREDLTTFDNRNDRAYASSHWDDKNVMIHTRKKDIELNGDHTLLVEELQSDWHQEGRKSGYRDKEARKLYDQVESIYDKYGVPFRGRITNREYAKLEEAGLTMEEDKLIDRYESQHGIPQAPHSKTWHELGMKQVIDEAVQKGYDRVAWVDGKTQADRFSLSKQVDRLVYNKDAGVIAGYKDGKEVMYQSADESQLEALIGKEPAKKLMANEVHTGIHEIKGEQLDIGGDGMRGFYDKMLPDFIRKYTKKWGTELTKEKLPAGEEVWSFQVTDTMREDIKKNGQALYALPAAALFGYSQSNNDNSKTTKLFGSNL